MEAEDESQNMTRRISRRRIFGAIVAASLIAASVYFAFEHRRMDRAFYQWIDARPMTINVDLSQPSKVAAPFHQTCQSSHGEAFYLTVEALDDRRNAKLLRG